MAYQSKVTDLIPRRRSWRSYGAQELETEKRDQLRHFFNALETPFWGNTPRFDIIDAGPAGKGRPARLHKVLI